MLKVVETDLIYIQMALKQEAQVLILIQLEIHSSTWHLGNH